MDIHREQYRSRSALPGPRNGPGGRKACDRYVPRSAEAHGRAFQHSGTHVHRRLRSSSEGACNDHLLHQGHVPGQEGHGRVPAAPVFAHAGPCARVRRGAEFGRQAHPSGHLSRQGGAHPRSHFRTHLQGREGPGEGAHHQGRVDGDAFERDSRGAGDFRCRQHRPFRRTHYTESRYK